MKKKKIGTFFDLEKYYKDPLDLIVRNTGIVRHLRVNGIDGMEIRNVLRNFHGLKMEIPISNVGMDEHKKKQRQIDYARRHTLALINNSAITDEERECLFKIDRRLTNEYSPININKAGRPIIKLRFPSDEGGESEVKAKRLTQAYGFQVVLLHEYIKNHNRRYLQKDIFSLIVELFEFIHEVRITPNRISNFYKNNLKFL